MERAREVPFFLPVLVSWVPLVDVEEALLTLLHATRQHACDEVGDYCHRGAVAEDDKRFVLFGAAVSPNRIANVLQHRAQLMTIVHELKHTRSKTQLCFDLLPILLQQFGCMVNDVTNRRKGCHLALSTVGRPA